MATCTYACSVFIDNPNKPQAPAKPVAAEEGEGEGGDGAGGEDGAAAGGKTDKKSAPTSVSRKVSG